MRCCSSIPCAADALRRPSLGERPEDVRASVSEVTRRWGDSEFFHESFQRSFPDHSHDQQLEECWRRHMRRGASPAAAAAWYRGITGADVTDILSSVRVPVVVVRVRAPLERVRYLTDRLADARIVDAVDAAVSPFGAAEEHVLAELQALTADVARLPADRVLTTVLFTDIVDSSARAAALGDRAWADLLERHHALVRHELARHGGTEIDTAGDGFFATFDGPGRALRCAKAVIDGVSPLGLDVRAGVHTGECDVAGKVAGIAVVIGARVAALAKPAEVLATSTVKDLVAGSEISFQQRREFELKGVPHRWRLYALVG
jgi:class 3 adenylate cyclase